MVAKPPEHAFADKVFLFILVIVGSIMFFQRELFPIDRTMAPHDSCRKAVFSRLGHGGSASNRFRSFQHLVLVGKPFPLDQVIKVAHPHGSAGKFFPVVLVDLNVCFTT
jgi:hypothetical protein